jgi:class 3 adenylate cyclase
MGLGFCKPPENKVLPIVTSGQIQLRDTEVSERFIPLKGSWNLIWDEMLPPALIQENFKDERSRNVTVPSHWQEYEFLSSASDSTIQAVATYWIQINWVGEKKSISLRFPSMDTCFVAYWNGKEIARNSQLNSEWRNKNTEPIYYAPITVDVEAAEKNILVLHLSNDVYPRAGFRDTILLGSRSQIHAFHERNAYFDIFLFGALSLMALYHLGIYALRPKDLSPFYFAIFCILIALRLMVTGEAVAFDLIPITWRISTFFEYLTFYLAPGVMLLFIRSLYPMERLKYVDETVYGITCFFGLIPIVFPLEVYSKTLVYFQIIALFIAIYCLGILFMANIRKRETARSFMLGAAILVFTLLNDMLYAMRVIESFYSVPIGLFLFFFAQAFLLSRRFALAFQTAEDLTLKLEQKVQERTRDLEEARNQSDSLLRNILPDEVASELKNSGKVKPQYHSLVTVIFIDFVNFTEISEKWHPNSLVGELDTCFHAFDEIMERNHLEKLKTIGDSYMAAAGIPIAIPDHAYLACEAALEIVSWMNAYQTRMELEGKRTWSFRIGIHTGPVTAGVIGSKKFAYDIWGDTVNTASRMESYCNPGEINISESTYTIVQSKYDCIPRGSVEVKGKGEMMMYRLLSRKKPGIPV